MGMRGYCDAKFQTQVLPVYIRLVQEHALESHAVRCTSRPGLHISRKETDLVQEDYGYWNMCQLTLALDYNMTTGLRRHARPAI